MAQLLTKSVELSRIGLEELKQLGAELGKVLDLVFVLLQIQISDYLVIIVQMTIGGSMYGISVLLLILF